jgi:hypothetical protein
VEKTPKKELLVKILKFTALIPLLPYPIILMANLMSLMGHRTGNESDEVITNTYSFLIFSSLYPLTLIYSFIRNKNRKISIAVLPLLHLAISIYLGIKWMNTV